MMKSILVCIFAVAISLVWAVEIAPEDSCVAFCFFQAVEKVGCKDNPASCYCRDPSSKKGRKISDAVGNCALKNCNEGWPNEYFRFNQDMCAPEILKPTCGPKSKSTCPADRGCVRFPDKINRCAAKRDTCQKEVDCDYLHGERCVEGSCYVPAGTKKLGEPCDGNECDVRLLCDGKCKSLDKCSVSNDCFRDLKCFDQTCRGPGRRGEACHGTLDCAGALVCSNQKCQDRTYLSPGESCILDLQCGSAHCKDGVCADYWDGKCTNDSDCASGDWCYGGPGGSRCCKMNSPSDSECRTHSK